MNKNIGIVGLGLIGGSFASALKSKTAHVVYGFDIDEKTLSDAVATKAIDHILTPDVYNVCDVLIIALFPSDTKTFVLDNQSRFKKGTVIIDCVGVKENICGELSAICHQNELYFIGGHPMAGKENWGFDNATSELFDNASMILCTDQYTNSVALKQAEILLKSVGFAHITITTPCEHDKIIAFTSQLAHVVSSAYIKSETATLHSGFSAGSFRDMTRVAKLNEAMWTELFFENKTHLLHEIDSIIMRLGEYKNALETNDSTLMKKLLLDGRLAKEATTSI